MVNCGWLDEVKAVGLVPELGSIYPYNHSSTNLVRRTVDGPLLFADLV